MPALLATKGKAHVAYMLGMIHTLLKGTGARPVLELAGAHHLAAVEVQCPPASQLAINR